MVDLAGNSDKNCFKIIKTNHRSKTRLFPFLLVSGEMLTVQLMLIPKVKLFFIYHTNFSLSVFHLISFGSHGFESHHTS